MPLMPAIGQLPKGVRVQMRRMRFDLNDDVDAHWMRDSAFLTHFFNALSALFPEGERFFIESVRRFESKLDDPELRAQVREFVRQEGHHSLQHRLLNERATEQGLPMAQYERFTRGMLNLARTFRTPRQQLAITTALEHFTALLGDLVFEHPAVLDGMAPKLKPLWAWHAAEETEHKGVAYDVYRAAGGGYFTRVHAQIESTAFFFVVVHAIQAHMMWKDRKSVSLRDTLRGLDYLWGREGYLRRVVPAYLQWYRPGFHPWQHDNSAVIERWKSENARYQVAPLQAA